MYKDRTARVPGTENYRFCEPSWVALTPPWHIRKLTASGQKLGGGADSPALCGLNLRHGWDLDVVITEQHLEHACARCAEELRKVIADI